MPPPCSRSEPGARGRLLLVAASAAVAVVWLVLLPWLGARPGLRERIRREEASGIDPSAMFYSELKSVRPIAEQVDRLREENPSAFWGE